jgi:translation initiation factor IF-2
LQEEERQRQEVIKAKAVVTAPKQVGKIELDPKKQNVISEAPVSEQKEVAPQTPEVKTTPEVKISEEVKEHKEEKQAPKKVEIVKPVIEPVSETTEEGEVKIETQYQKLIWSYFYRSKN